MNDTTAALERFRHRETARIERWLKPGSRILDIGAGTGYQASIFHQRGCHVVAVDVAMRAPDVSRFTVYPFDGVNLPFRHAAFDVVFTSNVLEHVSRRHDLLQECWRVLKPGGHVIHVVPSASWRIWTSVVRPICLLRAAIRGPRLAVVGTEPTLGQRRRSLIDVLLGRAHGEFHDSVAEMLAYRRSVWKRETEINGSELLEAAGNRLFYSGYTLFPHLSLRNREVLSRLAGSSCHIFVWRRPEQIRRSNEHR